MRPVSPCVARKKCPQLYPIKRDKAHTCDIFLFYLRVKRALVCLIINIQIEILLKPLGRKNTFSDVRFGDIKFRGNFRSLL